MPVFQLRSDYQPRGDQPKAIAALSAGVREGARYQTLLGVTGSGKTFTMANVIARMQKPTLVIAPNKTLAAQLYGDFLDLFPQNAVEYFVSYYDYYQPEAYLPATDTYIEKETLINEEIDRLRHAATHALRTREDVIVVASVSCIFGMGEAPAYFRLAVRVEAGEALERDELLRRLVEAHYQRQEMELSRGGFRVRGDNVEVFPPYEQDRALRLEFFGDMVERLSEVDPVSGAVLAGLDRVNIYPATHYVTEPVRRLAAIDSIRQELAERLEELKAQGKPVEAERLRRRTLHDLEMLSLFGYCPGIENYSRHLSGRAPGEPPACLLDYFPPEFLVFLDESHQTVPQIAGMYRSDRARKQTLIDYGFRLPSALDNRPLKFHEFEALVPQAVFVSATPGPYELKKSQGRVVEQIVRPTGLLDPEVEVRPASRQAEDLLGQIRTRSAAGERTLVTCLTKRMAEDLTDYYLELGVKCMYLHADIDTLQRVEIVRDLRLGRYDVLIGINLLREGLDIPEASLVGILDADKESFLRSHISLIQTLGRVSRHLHGKGILYGDRITRSMKTAMEETERRRAIQRRYNEEHGITPETIRSRIRDPLAFRYDAAPQALPLPEEGLGKVFSREEIRARMAAYAQRMKQAAQELRFEEAARWRDKLALLKEMDLEIKPPYQGLVEDKP